MESTDKSVDAIFAEAKEAIAADMKARGIGAIIWDNASAGFHQIPEIVHHSSKDPEKTRVARIMGLYCYEGTLYEIEEDRAPVKFDDFWDKDTEAAPTVVTLSEDIAVKDLGDPEKTKGYTTQGTLEEWTVIADCYFEALDEG